MQRRRRDVVGWVITPGEIKGRMVALDALIQMLRGDIRASKSPRIDAAFRDAFDRFETRWLAFYGSTAEWSGRLFATRWEPRYRDFVAAYERWFASFQQRKLPTDAQASMPASPQLKDMSDDIIPDEIMETASSPLTWGMAMVAGVVLVVALAKTR